MISLLYIKSMILLVTSTMKFWKWLGKNLPFLILFMAMTHQLLYSMAVMCISECYACQGFPLVILIQLIFLII
ncbi:hypothetical protein C9165_14835 [Escherichia coli]|nr:hypothetical protein C9165_14835 [Escherichia coli]TJH01590.1 hypothetical protein C9166_14850 [Escherichia coli]